MDDYADWNLCRICGQPNTLSTDADPLMDSAIRHERCDRVIAEASKPSIIPPGIRTRDWDDIHTAEVNARTP